MFDNLTLLTDSYKPTHWPQYPPGTSAVYSFFESRGGRWSEVVFHGLQYALYRYLAGQVVRQRDLVEVASYLTPHFGRDTLLNVAGWERIVSVHRGCLPLRIKAVPEGTVVPTHNVLMTVENTDPQLPWLTNYVESLLVQTWYPISVATRSREMKKIILAALEESGTPADVAFKLHDFGFRGSTSVESAAIGGCAHLVNFQGTDTLPALMMARHYYDEPCAGFSIPAAEHSTITSWGRAHEVDAYRNMLDRYPEGLVAVVSDSYNVYEACANLWGGELRERVLERNGILVIRPDSGDPPAVIARVLDILGDRFGIVKNDKGFKVLHPKVRLIQGDGIDIDMLRVILDTIMKRGWSADNLAFGSGGGLLQKDLDRDTLKMAFKCSYAEVGGEGRDVMKDPITDAGKRSKAGRLALIKTPTGFETVRGTDVAGDQLVPVFENGVVLKRYKLNDIRARAAVSATAQPV